MSEAKRLNELLNLLKTNQKQLSQSAGIAQGSISAIISGRKRITRDILDAITKKYPSVSLDWLILGKGSPFVGVPYQEDIAQAKSNSPIISANIPDEIQARQNIGKNLALAAQKWNMTQSEMNDLLGIEGGRQATSTYFRGIVLPKFTVLLKFEQYTGWPLLDLASRQLSEKEIPEQPRQPAAAIKEPQTAFDLLDIRAEIQIISARLGKILSNMTADN